jgi:hypothetical protein
MDIAALDDQIKFRRIMALHELRLPARPLFRPSFRRSCKAPSGAMQRVSVKTYYFPPEKREGFVRYMAREGKGQEGAAPELFTENGKAPDDALHAEYPAEERYYKIILSPENGDQLDMERYTRDFMKSLAATEGREFKWAAAVHYDTEHPHAHILIRGVDEDGQAVAFSKDTIKYGMRGQASRLATMELGHRTALEMERQKAKDLRAERLTQLDRTIKERLDGRNMVRPGSREEQTRLDYLAAIGLASRNRNGSFTMDGRFDAKLTYLQRDNDILKTVYGRDAKMNDRDFTVYRKGWTVDGVILKKDIENEMTEKPYALVQDAKGRKYYVADHQLKDFNAGDRIHIAGAEKDGKKTTVITRGRDRDRERQEGRGR